MATINKAVNAAVKEMAQDKDPQAFVEELRAEVRSGSQRAVSQLQDLINLIVITYNEATLLKPNMSDFIGQFIDKARDDNGNGRRYIKHFPQKGNDYNANNFIPTTTSDMKFKVEFIKFKEANGTLAPGSIQKVWTITYIQSEMIQYFINSQLSVFIEEQILAQIEDSIRIFMYDYVMSKLVDTEPSSVTPKGKIMSGTGKNTFECIVELISEVKKMLNNSSTYNVDPTLTEAIDASKTEDLILLVSPKVKAMFETEIITQLFNSANIELSKHFGQIHVPNNKFNFTTATITTDATNYISDDKLIVIDRKNYLRILTMLKADGGQYFPLNMANMRAVHQWFASGNLPWGKVLTYKNANLTVSPSA